MIVYYYLASKLTDEFDFDLVWQAIYEAAGEHRFNKVKDDFPGIEVEKIRRQDEAALKALCSAAFLCTLGLSMEGLAYLMMKKEG